VLSRPPPPPLRARAAAGAAADALADLVGPILGWSEDEKAKQVKDFRATVAADHDLVRA
jgi:hypothetical protein